MSDSESKPEEQKKRPSSNFMDSGSTIVGGENLGIGLIQKLLEANVLSPAQAQLVLADQEVTGMSVEEVVLARGWVTEAKLDEIAPGRKKPDQQNSLRVSAGSKNYQQNFKQYRSLMERILGISWD
jgi:hypothetical protein